MRRRSSRQTVQPIGSLPITGPRKYRPRACLAILIPQLAGFVEMSEGDFKLELENATLRRLLEHATTDAARRDSAEKLQRLILEELHHRVKNTLAIVQSITNQSLRTAIDLPHAGEAISARFAALGRVPDLLLRTSWAGAMLPELLKTAIEPFETPGREQFRIQPTPIRINPAAALPFVMTINELYTNASKHGAGFSPLQIIADFVGRSRLSDVGWIGNRLYSLCLAPRSCASAVGRDLHLRQSDHCRRIGMGAAWRTPDIADVGWLRAGGRFSHRGVAARSRPSGTLMPAARSS
jgi:HWE histidine kinase